MVAQVPATHPAHHDWSALRRWLTEMEDDRVLGPIEYGVQSVLAYDQPDAVVTLPPSEVAGLQGSLAELALGAAAVLPMWGGPDASERSSELLDPATVRATLVALLNATWDGG